VIVAVLLTALSRILSCRRHSRAGAATRDALGRLSAICYPLLYACCNVLLLPGGFLSLGGVFFLGSGGFLINLVGMWRRGDLVLYQPVDRTTMAAPEADANPTLEALEQPSNERLEDHPAESVTSIVSDQPAELSLRPDADTVSHVYPLVAIGQAPGLFLYAYLGTLANWD
jgi:hypothetical protein